MSTLMTPVESRAADFADALAAVRRGKNILFVLLLLVLLVELALFFVARYSAALQIGPGGSAVHRQVLQYVTGLAAFLGLTLPVVFALFLTLILLVMLVGRLVGTDRSRGVSAGQCCWCRCSFRGSRS